MGAHPSSRRSAAAGALVALCVGAAVTPVAAGSGGEAAVVGPPVAARTERVSFAVDDAPLTEGSVTEGVAVSGDGRFVVFESDATNLVPGGPAPTSDTDVYVVDRLLGTLEQVSVTSDEVPGTLASYDASISANGRFIAFTSSASLVPEDTNVREDVYVRDRVLGTTTRVSLDDADAQLTSHAFRPDISADGRRIAFVTYQALEAGDTNGTSDVYVRDRIAGTTVRASLDEGDGEVASPVYEPSLDLDGSVVAFGSEGAFVAADGNALRDIFVRDLAAGTTVRASAAPGGADGDGASYAADLSASGRFVAFSTESSNLGDITDHVGGSSYIYRRDLTVDSTVLVSVTDTGTIGRRGYSPSISANGQRVAYANRDSSLFPGTACEPNLALRDIPSGDLQPALPRTNGTICGSRSPAISGDGRYVAGEASDPLLVDDPPEISAQRNVYIRILANASFPDVLPAHPFFEAISWLVDRGVTTGFADGGFHPASDVTRQAVSAFLYRYREASAVDPVTPTFSDVGLGHPFLTEIEWLVAEGLASGYADGGFHPTAPVSRQAMVAFLYRLAGEPAFVLPGTATFSDVGLGHPFATPIEWAASLGLVGGYADGGFHPTSPVTRQAAAAFLFRFELLGL